VVHRSAEQQCYPNSDSSPNHNNKDLIKTFNSQETLKEKEEDNISKSSIYSEIIGHATDTCHPESTDKN
jgi:hypothetical protein